MKVGSGPGVSSLVLLPLSPILQEFLIAMEISTIIIALFVAAVAAWLRFVKTGTVCKSRSLLIGKTVLLTGGNAGIGKATALELAKRKAKVIIACRNEEKARKAVEDIRKESKNDQVRFMKLDLSDLESVREFVKIFIRTETRLDILVNNASVLAQGESKQGYDLMFATNHLGPFLLTNLLLPMMRKHAETNHASIINVASDGYKFGKIDFQSAYLTKPKSDMLFKEVLAQYSNTKLMNIYFTTELNKRLRIENPESQIITTYSLHPGTVASDLGLDHMQKTSVLRVVRKVLVSLLGLSTYYGCQTSVYCCVAEGIEDLSGKYFNACAVSELWSLATDPIISEMLWKKSEEMAGIKYNDLLKK